MPTLEIVANEMRKLMMSADSFANTFHDIFRCPGVQSVIVSVGFNCYVIGCNCYWVSQGPSGKGTSINDVPY